MKTYNAIVTLSKTYLVCIEDLDDNDDPHKAIHEWGAWIIEQTGEKLGTTKIEVKEVKRVRS